MEGGDGGSEWATKTSALLCFPPTSMVHGTAQVGLSMTQSYSYLTAQLILITWQPLPPVVHPAPSLTILALPLCSILSEYFSDVLLSLGEHCWSSGRGPQFESSRRQNFSFVPLAVVGYLFTDQEAERCADQTSPSYAVVENQYFSTCSESIWPVTSLFFQFYLPTFRLMISDIQGIMYKSLYSKMVNAVFLIVGSTSLDVIHISNEGLSQERF